MLSRCSFIIFLSMFLGRCASNTYDLDNVQESFRALSLQFKDEKYEQLIKNASVFTARFPYSEKVAQVELYTADSHFALGEYIEAIIVYEQFSKIHTRHPKRAYALYQIGKCYWLDSSEEPSRDQDFTHKAIAAWEKYLSEYPKDILITDARSSIKKAYERIARSYHFVADYYCKMKRWHSCALRMEKLILSDIEYPLELKKQTYKKAAYALEKLVEADSEEENIYTQKYSKNDILQKSRTLRKISESF